MANADFAEFLKTLPQDQEPTPNEGATDFAEYLGTLPQDQEPSTEPVDLLDQGQAVLMGVQEGFRNLVQGGADLVLGALRHMPGAGAEVDRFAQQAEIALNAVRGQQAREFEEKTQGAETAATVGRIVGEAAPLAGVGPAVGLTGGLLRGLAKGAGVGAGLAQVPNLEEGETRAGRAASGALGGAAGVTVGRGIDAVARRLGRTRPAVTDPDGGAEADAVRENVRRGLNQMEAERLAAMERQGFTGQAAPTRGQVTREQQQQKIENTLRATEPGGALRDRARSQEQVARDTFPAREIALGGGEEGVSPIVRTRRTLDALRKAEEISRKAVHKLFDEASEGAPNLLMKTDSFQAMMDDVFEEGGDEAVKVARRLLDRRGTVRDERTFLTPKSARVVEEKLSKAAASASDRKDAMFLRRLQSALNDDMADVGGNFFGAAKAAHQKHAERFRDLKNVNQFIRGDLPVDDVLPGLMGKWKNDAAVGFVNTLKKEAPESIDQIRGAVLNELGRKAQQGRQLTEKEGDRALSSANLVKAWEGIKPEVKAAIFTKQQAKDLDEFVSSFHLMFNQVAGTVNTSGSATVAIDWLQRAAGAKSFTMSGRILQKGLAKAKSAQQRQQNEQAVRASLNPFPPSQAPARQPSGLARGAAGTTRQGVIGADRESTRGR
ncbi:MAG: DUF4259 domain-containing protein [Hyphomicrobiales bacterium]